MAKNSDWKQGKRARNYQGHKAQQRVRTTSLLVLGVGVLVLALLAAGMAQVLGFGFFQSAAPANVEFNAGNLQATSLEERGTVPDTASPVSTTNRETRYLGPPSDPATLGLAEVGEVGQPTLLWFHADWCHVCQQIKPEVVNLGEQYEGKVKIVRLNIDHGVSREAVRRYGVRATPTFVLFDTQGQPRGNVPGWPGYQTFTNAFDQLLAGG